MSQDPLVWDIIWMEADLFILNGKQIAPAGAYLSPTVAAAAGSESYFASCWSASLSRLSALGLSPCDTSTIRAAHLRVLLIRSDDEVGMRFTSLY
eukprot:4075098-Pleurochrysis_carterae.AAC.2